MERNIPFNFDWLYYYYNNPEIALSGMGRNKEEMENHYLTWGQSEERQFSNILEIDDENKPFYSLGDLLSTPSFWAHWWGKRTHADHYFLAGYKVVVENYPDSLLSIYSSLSSHLQDEIIPNIEVLNSSTNLYIQRNNIHDNKIVKKITQDDCLCVHLRLGDKGPISEDFFDKIKDLSEKYNTIVIFTGVHKDARFDNIKSCIEKTNSSLVKLLDKINTKIIIDYSPPDVHIGYMALCKNLLLHRGGFSILGGLVFTGENLYVTHLFEPCSHTASLNFWDTVPCKNVIRLTN